MLHNSSSCSLNWASKHSGMSWLSTCFCRAWSPWQGIRSWCKDRKPLLILWCWLSALIRLWCGVAISFAPSIHTHVGMLQMPLMVVVECLNTPTVALRGLRPWCWVRCSATSALIVFATTVGKRGTLKQRVFSCILSFKHVARRWWTWCTHTCYHHHRPPVVNKLSQKTEFGQFPDVRC